MRHLTGSRLSYSAELLFQLVKRWPGIHLREAQRRSGLGLGNTVYQLEKLNSLGLIDSDKIGKYKRYYPFEFDTGDRNILSTLFISSRRRILLFLLAYQKSNLSELASSLGLSKSTVGWHIKILESNGMVTATRSLDTDLQYRLTDPIAVTNAFSRFRSSIVDRFTERFLKSWELLDKSTD